MHQGALFADPLQNIGDFEDDDFQERLPNAARMPSIPRPEIAPVQFGEDVDYPDPVPFDED